LEETELIREFLIESNENLSRLDQEMVDLEKHPDDANLLASIFRTVHTIKGTCGFLNFGTLETITHQAENILGQLRNGQRKLTQGLTSVLLETIDAIKRELDSIEETGVESGEVYTDLLQRQKAIAEQTEDIADERALLPQLSEKRLEPEPVASEPEPLPSNEKRRSDDTVPVADSTIRVDVALLNRLMNLVGELVLARNQILQFSTRSENSSLNATAQKLNLITTELQEGVMRTRMQPIGNVWASLPRVVRDLATTCGKRISLKMDGAETELDKTIIEAIKDPLTHIVRNACDHGIETPEARIRAGKPAEGTLTLSAFHEGGNVNIEIIDDGAGLDSQRIKTCALKKGLVSPDRAERMTDRELATLIFVPGFSTAEHVSSISGRGVGMDVVKTNIEKIGGTVDLASRTGQGMTIRIKIPLTLAIIPGLVVISGGERFVIPQVSLLELLCLEGDKAKSQIEEINGTPVYRRRGQLLPLARLNKVLNVHTNSRDAENIVSIVVLQAEDKQFGLIVDAINDTQEIVVKPLGGLLKNIKGYAGATIMGDGKIALILDVLGIAQVSGVLSDTTTDALRSEDPTASEEKLADKETLLLFCAGPFERLAVPLSLVARLEEFSPSSIERAAGGLVVQYRGQILPLVHLASQLGSNVAAEVPDPFTAIVFADGERRVGLIVDKIIDIIEDRVTVRKASSHPSLLGSAVAGGKVTDFLDIHAVTQALDKSWSVDELADGKQSTVLLAEGSPFSRGLVRSYLEVAGHRVIEATTCQEALHKIDRDRIHAVVAALDLPDRGAFTLLGSVRRRAVTPPIPVIALTHRKDGSGHHEGNAFSDCLFKYDREAMLRSLDRLAQAADSAHLQDQELAGAETC
jgi:two-component system chemotaxis sensor kinase CheA